MEREYLEDYEQKELDEYKRLEKRIMDGRFSFGKDKYPPDDRFVKLKKPTAFSAFVASTSKNNLWAQIPFCGSLILPIVPVSKFGFEEIYFKASKIPRIIDFVNETGRLQVVLAANPLSYEGLDHLDLFFKELNPPVLYSIPLPVFGDDKEIQKAMQTFFALAKVNYLNFFRNLWRYHGSSRLVSETLEHTMYIYTVLKLGRYAIVRDLENSMVDNPEDAYWQFILCRKFITDPIADLLSDLRNYTLEDVKSATATLPLFYLPEKIRFPCEIGKFLMKKLTFAPQGLRACNELIDEYDAYDMRKIVELLNDAIVANHPDIVNKSVEDLSEILDNIWNDKTLPKRVKGLKVGIPLSMAAIGSVAAGPIGAAGGFLAGLGFNVAHKLIDVETTGLSERLAKLRTKSYQANIYDFKKKYKAKIAHP